MRSSTFSIVASLFLLFVSPAHAQFTTASFGGNVVDSNNAVLPQSQVSVRNVDTGFTQSATTDASGAFLFPRLPVGSYELRVERPGFSRYVRTGITLTVDQAASLTVVMQVGQVSEEVTVQANTELVGTRNGTLGQLVDQQRVVELPLNGRMAQSLVFLAAGTVDLGRNGCRICGHGGVYPGEQTAGVNGAGMAQVNYQLDGAGHNDTYLNVNVPFPNPDAVQEFNLQASNFTAEYGNAAGGIVNIVTRSGTNVIRGSLFEFLRDGSLNARNFFAPTKDTLKRNQFGGSAGGPIVKDRLFYFGTYQGTRIRSEAAGRVAFVPTAAERGGDFSALSVQLVDPVTRQPFANNQIPPGRISPVAKYFLDWIPLPNRGGRELNFVGTEQVETENQFMTKVEYNRRGHQISGRYFFTDYDRPAVIPEDNILAASNAGNAVRVQNVSVNHTFSIRPTLLLNSTFGFNRQRGGSLSSGPFSYPDAGVRISSAAASALKAPPELVMSVTGAFSINTNHLGDFDRGDFTIREDLTAVLGPHEMHFGGEAVRLSNHITNTFRMDGNFTFNGQLSGDGLADFLLGRASSFVQGGGEFKDLKGTRWGFFAQDNWRANQRLTLNLGVRWDPYFPYYDREGRVVCFQPGAKSQRYPNAPAGMLYGGTDHDPGCPVGGSNANVWNIAPRIGFAYRLTRGRQDEPPRRIRPLLHANPGERLQPVYEHRAVRSGILVQRRVLRGSVRQRRSAKPVSRAIRAAGPGSRGHVRDARRAAAVFARDFRTPLLMSWNVSLERQVGTDWVFRIAYIGNKGNILLWRRREQSRNQPGDLRARRVDGGKHPGQAPVPGLQPHRTVRVHEHQQVQLDAAECREAVREGTVGAGQLHVFAKDG